MKSKLIFLLSVLLLFTVACGGGGEQSDEEYAEAMSEEHEGDTPEASPAAEDETVTEGETAAELETAEVVYGAVDGDEVSGYLAKPANAEPGTPGVIVIQEWWGLNDNIRAMADKLAAEGHVALAVDLYGGEPATDPEGARALMQAAMETPEKLEENLREAYRFLTEEQGAEKVGSIGWCFGGGWSLRTALLYPQELDAAVIYYGRVTTEREELEPLEVPILGHFGALDDGIPVEGVKEFESVLAELGKNATIHVYEDADHAFANPSGSRYQEEAAETAWQRTLDFFAEHLGS